MDACRPLHVRNNDDLSKAEQCCITESRLNWLFSAYQRGQSLENLIVERYTKWRASRVIVISGLLALIIRRDNKGRKLWRRGNVHA